MHGSGSEDFKWEVPFEDEIPLKELPRVPFASENYCYTGYDPVRQLAFFLHIGRWVKDTSIFRETLMVYLPDGSLLLHQAFGRNDLSQGPWGSNLRLLTEEPGKKIRIQFVAPVQHVPLNKIHDVRAMPREYDRVELDLEFVGTQPTWYFEASDNTTWAKWHTEQQGLATGTLKHGSNEYQFEGVSYRDHSRGPRELSDWRAHTWIQGQFDDRSSFAIYQVWQMADGRENEALSEAKVFQNDQILTARVLQTPRLSSTANMFEPYELVLESDAGRWSVIGRPQASSITTFASDFSHFLFGVPYGDPNYVYTCIEQPSKFDWNGREAIGWTERSFSRVEAEAFLSPRRVASFIAGRS